MRIVLVDPSIAVQHAMTQMIAEDGHQVVSFADGLQALSAIAREPDIRALITSTMPNNISGLDLCKAARELSGLRRALHIILMSSTDDYYLAVKALDNGADDFIPKPPNPHELRARLRLADRVTSMKQELIRYATTDSLTGLLNRRAFFDGAAEFCAAADAEPISAIMFDVDHFKKVNDNYGHDAGDRVLAAIGAQAALIDGISGRLGGEEFCVLVRGSAADAQDQASDLQRAIRALTFNHEGRKFNVTASFGIAEWERGDAIDRLLRRADVAMYEAKQAGRDRIVVSDTFALTDEHDEFRGAARTGRRK